MFNSNIASPKQSSLQLTQEEQNLLQNQIQNRNNVENMPGQPIQIISDHSSTMNSTQPIQQFDPTFHFQKNQYIQNQYNRIKQDEKDRQTLSDQILKIKKFKHYVSQQQKQIKQLSKQVSDLKNQNQTLRNDRSSSCKSRIPSTLRRLDTFGPIQSKQNYPQINNHLLSNQETLRPLASIEFSPNLSGQIGKRVNKSKIKCYPGQFYSPRKSGKIFGATNQTFATFNSPSSKPMLSSFLDSPYVSRRIFTETSPLSYLQKYQNRFDKIISPQRGQLYRYQGQIDKELDLMDKIFVSIKRSPFN